MTIVADGAGQDAGKISAARCKFGDPHAFVDAREGQEFSRLSVGVARNIFRRADGIGDRGRAKESKDRHCWA
jgi:hypothetical protein